MTKFKSKPSYDLYVQLWYTLDTYLVTRIYRYMYFKHNEWLDIIKLKELSV